jgi:transcription initiation factor TFIIIB Brf1 subunit/transcription initiation factor TFIIB
LKKQEKSMHGTRSEAFALAVIFAAMNHAGQGRSFKVEKGENCEMFFHLFCQELAAMANLVEKDVRNQYKHLQKVLPEKLAERITSAADFIRVIVSDLQAEFLLESFAVDLHNRAMNHECLPGCGRLLEGKRPSSLAAGAVLQAAHLAKVGKKKVFFSLFL